jgi:hypothetical protein
MSGYLALAAYIATVTVTALLLMGHQHPPTRAGAEAMCECGRPVHTGPCPEGPPPR